MKNFDLIWAREWVGLTQDQAAELMSVDRRTFGRWEAGTVPMPAKKWTRFLSKTKVEKKDIPARKEYDEDGYPVGFDRVLFDDLEPVEPNGWDMFAALSAIEGDEFESRRRERHRLMLIKFYEVCARKGPPGGMTQYSVVSTEMSLYDANLEKLRGTQYEYDREVCVRQVVFEATHAQKCGWTGTQAQDPSEWLDAEIVDSYGGQERPASARVPRDVFPDLG